MELEIENEEHLPFLPFVVLNAVGQKRGGKGRLLLPAPPFLFDVNLLLLPLPDDLLYPLPALGPLVFLRPAMRYSQIMSVPLLGK